MISDKWVAHIFKYVTLALFSGLMIYLNSHNQTGMVTVGACVFIAFLIFGLLWNFSENNREGYVYLVFISLCLVSITICQCSAFNNYTPEYPLNPIYVVRFLVLNYIIIFAIALYVVGIKKAMLNLLINAACLVLCYYKLNLIAALIVVVQCILVFGITFIPKEMFKFSNKTKIRLITACLEFVTFTFINYFYLAAIMSKYCYMYTYKELSLLISVFVSFAVVYYGLMSHGWWFSPKSKKFHFLEWVLVLSASAVLSGFLYNFLDTFADLPFGMYACYHNIYSAFPVLAHIISVLVAVIPFLALFELYFVGNWLGLINKKVRKLVQTSTTHANNKWNDLENLAQTNVNCS